MALGQMSYAESLNCAQELDLSATNMEKCFEDLKREMDTLTNDLESDAGNDLYAQFMLLNGKLAGFPNKIKEFSVFLRKAVSQYQHDDEALKREVN